MNLQLMRCLTLTALGMASAVLGQAQSQHLTVRPFGKADGRDISQYTFKNASGMEVKVITYGGRITSIKVPDRQKQFGDVVLGFDSIDGYTATNPFFGALVGRYANRIANGTFSLDGKQYQIPVTDGPNALHGGKIGFDKRVWEAQDVSTAHIQALQLTYVSKDGEEGFPGNLTATVRYSLDDRNNFRIDYGATTDKDTVLNLTNHSYFNLSGPGSGTILKDKIMIAADRFTPVNKNLIPTGVLQPVAGTPFDFRKAAAISSRIEGKDEQLKFGKGIDHNFVLNHAAGVIGLAARVEDPDSGRVMEVSTDQPGIQFYTGNFLDGKNTGIGGKYDYRTALCLETQHYPDSPNQPKFPSAELKPGQHFHATTIFHFAVE